MTEDFESARGTMTLFGFIGWAIALLGVASFFFAPDGSSVWIELASASYLFFAGITLWVICKVGIAVTYVADNSAKMVESLHQISRRSGS